MVGSDYYPDGHQGGVGIIQNGERTATNGDLRLEPTPGQWQPMPKVVGREVDPAAREIRLRLAYPDEKKNRTGFNPIDYPDLNLAYTVRVTPADGNAFRIVVDLDQPLPAAWVGRVGFNLELYPGILFGKTFRLGDTAGIFPREAIGPGAVDPVSHTYQLAPLAGGGRELVIAPESETQRLAPRWPGGAQQRLVRRARRGRRRRDQGGARMARDAARHSRLALCPGRPGVAGGIPSGAAEGRSGRARCPG